MNCRARGRRLRRWQIATTCGCITTKTRKEKKNDTCRAGAVDFELANFTRRGVDALADKVGALGELLTIQRKVSLMLRNLPFVLCEQLFNFLRVTDQDLKVIHFFHEWDRYHFN